MNTEYKRIEDLPGYVALQLGRGTKTVSAEKTARIRARKGLPGEEVITWTVDGKGEPLQEKKAAVTVDAETGKPDWVAAKAEENGCVIVDANGNSNQWIIADDVFCRKYEADEKIPGLFRPKGGVQRFLPLKEAVSILQWGEEWNVDAGGYINITDPNDLYVISRRDFEDIYKIIGA